MSTTNLKLPGSLKLPKEDIELVTYLKNSMIADYALDAYYERLQKEIQSKILVMIQNYHTIFIIHQTLMARNVANATVLKIVEGFRKRKVGIVFKEDTDEIDHIRYFNRKLPPIQIEDKGKDNGSNIINS